MNELATPISIIIPVLNEEAALEGTLQAVTGLPENPEVIVVDGGSDDKSIAIASRYATVISSRRGRAAQMNAGAWIAHGDVLLFLHADTRLPPGALAAVAASLQQPGVIAGRFRVRLDQRGWRYRWVETSINVRDRLLGGYTGDQAIFVSADIFRRIGGYSDFALMEDLDLGRRLSSFGRVARLPLAVTTSARRWQQGGVLRTVARMWMLRGLYLLGVSPARLAGLYRDAR